MQTLTDKLAEKLGGSVKTNTEVLKIEKTADGKIAVLTEHRHPAGKERDDAGKMPVFRQVFDALIISTPAASAAKLTENLDVNLSAQLKNIYYPPIAMVFFGVKKESLKQYLDGFGFLVPSLEKRNILGTIWNSAVFENRAPDGYHLLTNFVGGARNAELFEKSNAELFDLVYQELKDILGLRVKPEFTHIKRWRKAIPQYLLGYEKVENSIEEFELNNRCIYFCSNFYKGISVGDCVKNAFVLADEIEKRLSHEQTRKGTK